MVHQVIVIAMMMRGMRLMRMSIVRMSVEVGECVCVCV